MKYKPPFPWHGGKAKISSLVWSRMGDVNTYIEPFFGSGAVLFNRPHYRGQEEFINDLDGFVANFWRAVKHAPQNVAEHCDWPVSEVDVTARHRWLYDQSPAFLSRMLDDPDFYDAKVAGWWAWGLCQWISGGWCNVKGGRPGKRMAHINTTPGVLSQHKDLYAYFEQIARRLRHVKVVCQDWSSVLAPCHVAGWHGLTGVFLDPPYLLTAGRAKGCYAEDGGEVAHAVREWAIANGDNPQVRIALCGFDTEHVMPASWDCVAWDTAGGYTYLHGKSKPNAGRERIWFSPHCVKPDLFGA